MASSEVKAKPRSDVTPVGENTLDFDDDTLRGKESRHFLAPVITNIKCCKNVESTDDS